MKKLLLSSAVCALAVVATPAFAQEDSALKLNVGGYFKGYAVYHNQDEVAGPALTTSDARSFDILRDTEVHFGGETTLDNGLTVGAQIEAAADDGDGFGVDESYVYFAGSWGRVNFGDEDGAAYLLQVAAPSADENYDGIRQFVNPTSYATGLNALAATDYASGATGVGGTVTPFGVANDGLDYDNDVTTDADKFTYLSPVFNGFQAAVSYTPDVASFGATSRTFGTSLDDTNNTWGEGYEGAVRYEGQFNTVGFIIGAGYTHVDLEEEVTATNLDDLKEWNVGLDLDIGPFGIGAVWTENNGAQDSNGDGETWVVGADYTTGPFKLGASYLNREKEETVTTDVDTDRYTGGVVYTYGPGMTFRGSISHVDEEGPTTLDNDDTSVLLGTQINF